MGFDFTPRSARKLCEAARKILGSGPPQRASKRRIVATNQWRLLKVIEHIEDGKYTASEVVPTSADFNELEGGLEFSEDGAVGLLQEMNGNETVQADRIVFGRPVGASQSDDSAGDPEVRFLFTFCCNDTGA